MVKYREFSPNKKGNVCNVLYIRGLRQSQSPGVDVSGDNVEYTVDVLPPSEESRRRDEDPLKQSARCFSMILGRAESFACATQTDQILLPNCCRCSTTYCIN